MGLTDRQRQILRFIADYKARHGAPPTLREIAQHCRIYLRGVQYHLDRLERAGFDVFTSRPALAAPDVPGLLWGAFAWRPSRPA